MIPKITVLLAVTFTLQSIKIDSILRRILPKF